MAMPHLCIFTARNSFSLLLNLLNPLIPHGFGYAIIFSQLGFIHGGVATTLSHFGDVDMDFDMDQVICSGFEDELQECDYDTVSDCVGHEAAGVFCHDY